MTDRPLLLSAPMVLAVLREIKHPGAGKTQTRRLETSPLFKCEVGDRLWVREAWKTSDTFNKDSPAEIGSKAVEAGYPRPWMPIYYTADGTSINWYGDSPCGRLRPGMHLPRWSSRLTLTVTDVRTQRLHDITDEDAIAEGVTRDEDAGSWTLNLGCGYESGYWWHVPGIAHPNKDFPSLSRGTPREMYAALWDVLHGSGKWLSDPPVVTVSFRPELRNIDR